jgi:hypothetical protein
LWESAVTLRSETEDERKRRKNGTRKERRHKMMKKPKQRMEKYGNK